MPPSPWLSSIREKISENPDDFVKIINAKGFVKYFGNIDGERLKTAPKGYPSNHPNIELLKFKSFLATNLVSDKMVTSNSFFEHVINVFRAMKPFNDFLNDF